MTSPFKEERRILAIDSGTKGFGFAVMEGPERLVDWGVKGGKENKNSKSLELVSGLISHYQPDVVVVEDADGPGSRPWERVREMIAGIQKLCVEKKIKVRSFSRSQVKETFSGATVPNKHQIASAICERLPELAPRLPPLRKAWMSEDYRMSIFDALSFALTFFHSEEKGNGPS